MHAIGVNTWVWTSPLDDPALVELAAKAAAEGFDVLELPVENPGDWDPAAAARVLSDHGLGASVCLVMPPDVNSSMPPRTPSPPPRTICGMSSTSPRRSGHP